MFESFHVYVGPARRRAGSQIHRWQSRQSLKGAIKQRQRNPIYHVVRPDLKEIQSTVFGRGRARERFSCNFGFRKLVSIMA